MKQSPLFSRVETSQSYFDETEHASFKGVTIKTIILLLIAAGIAAVTAFALPAIIKNNLTPFYIILIIASILGFISAIAGRISDRAAKYWSVVYSICEGLFLGTITRIAEEFLPGAGIIAISATLIIFGVMLLLYSNGIIKVNKLYMRIVIAMGICALFLVISTLIISLVMYNSMAANETVSSMGFSTYLWMMIGVEAFLLIYGVITLALNFEEANQVVKNGCSKSAEWSVALGMEISLIYIYIEIIRLIIYIAILSRKD